MWTKGSTLIQWIVITMVLATSACSPELPAPSPTPLPPTSTPNLALTAQARTMTAVAAFSPTPSKTPTVTKTQYPTITPIPSSTPIQSITPTPALTSANGTDVSGTPQDTPSADYACKVTFKFPSDWSILKSGDWFDGNWKIKNTGLNTWKFGKVMLTFVNGNKFQEHKDNTTFNIPSDVRPGEDTSLLVDMIAPTKPDNYASNWGLLLTSTKTVFCNFSLRITVQR